MVELMVYYWKVKKKLQITNCCESGPIYMEKSYPGKRDGHPPSQVTSNNRLQEKQVDTFRVFGSIWKYRVQWFSWRTCTGANVECWRHELLGGPGACPPPREIGKIGLSKMQFPAFPGPELGNRNYDRNYLFFFFDCVHYITKWVK